MRPLWPALVAGIAVTAHAAEPTPFAQAVTRAMPDWTAEDWRHGGVVLHPSQFTWQSDDALELLPEEPTAGRPPQAALEDAWRTAMVDGRTIDLHGAQEQAPGVLARPLRWRFGFDDNLGVWGVATTAGGYLPFRITCNLALKSYDGQRCLKRALTLLLLAKSGQLALPTPPAPLTVGGWDGQYLADGSSVLVHSNFNGLRRATIRVSAPLDPPSARADIIERYAEATAEGADGPAAAGQWSGPPDVAWFRRTFERALDGPAVQITGAVPVPGGRVVLLSLRCPNPSWMDICTQGTAAAIRFLGSGIVERRRQALIAAANQPPPAGGLTDADILGVYTVSRHAMGAGGFMTGFEVTGHLFLRDGSVRQRFDQAPALIRRGEPPDQWGRWTRDGDQLAITWPGGRAEQVAVTADTLMVGATPGLRLDGLFRRVSGGGNVAFGGGSSSLAESTYRFHPDGTFRSDRGSSVLVGPAAAGATATGGSTGPTTAGRYALDGYTLTLTYGDGRRVLLSVAVAQAERQGPVQRGVLLDGRYYFADGKD